MNPPAIHFSVPAQAPLLRTVAAPALRSERFLTAIQTVEGATVPHKVGFYGLTSIVWRQHSRLPFAYAFAKVHARHVAEQHLRWLENSLRADGYKATVYEIAVCWKHGFEGGKAVINNPAFGYGRRVESLYESPLSLP